MWKTWLVVVVVAVFVCTRTVPYTVIKVINTPETVTIPELLDRGHRIDLSRLEKLGLNQLTGPESTEHDGHGIYYAGTADGKIIRVFQSNSSVETISTIGGRPLGLYLTHSPERIYVAEATQGLLQVDLDGSTKLLTNSVNGRQIRYANDLDFDEANQLIYFSDSSVIAPIFEASTGLWSTMKAALVDLFAGFPTGRLLRYDLKTQFSEELLSDIAYANGVTLSKDKSFVLVVETGRLRVLRYWLKGPKAGESEIFLDGLPGYPDGISTNERGNFWLALIAPRSKLVEYVHRFPFVKKFILSLTYPDSLAPENKLGLVLEISPQAQIVNCLYDTSGTLSAISSVVEDNNSLLFGGLDRPFISVYHLKLSSS